MGCQCCEVMYFEEYVCVWQQVLHYTALSRCSSRERGCGRERGCPSDSVIMIAFGAFYIVPHNKNAHVFVCATQSMNSCFLCLSNRACFTTGARAGARPVRARGRQHGARAALHAAACHGTRAEPATDPGVCFMCVYRSVCVAALHAAACHGSRAKPETGPGVCLCVSIIYASVCVSVFVCVCMCVCVYVCGCTPCSRVSWYVPEESKLASRFVCGCAGGWVHTCMCTCANEMVMDLPYLHMYLLSARVAK